MEIFYLVGDLTSSWDARGPRPFQARFLFKISYFLLFPGGFLILFPGPGGPSNFLSFLLTSFLIQQAPLYKCTDLAYYWEDSIQTNKGCAYKKV